MKKLTTRQKAHRAYLMTDEWAKVRADILEDSDFKCERCDSKENLQVHHLNYYRFGGNETRSDLIVLCQYHHMLEHGLVTKRKKGWEKRKLVKKKETEFGQYRRIFFKATGINNNFKKIKKWSELARAMAWVLDHNNKAIFKKHKKAKAYVENNISRCNVKLKVHT